MVYYSVFFLTLEMNPYLIYLRKIIMLDKGLLLAHKVKKLNMIQLLVSNGF